MPNLVLRHVNQGFFLFLTNSASKFLKGGSTADKFLTNFNIGAYLKGPSHQIRFAWKWYGSLGPGQDM